MNGAPVRAHADYEGAGGGGGSSYGTAGAEYSLALQPGNGSIILTYLEDPGCDTQPTTTLAPTTTAAAQAQALQPTFTG